MKKENTASRLNEIMEKRNLRQVDILNLTRPYCQEYNVKMNKSDISQYCSGKTEPNQDKLFVLGMALNVNEAWLMGYDIPMKRYGEDQNILKYDAELEHALDIIENSGYTWNYSMDPDYDIIIKNSSNEIVSCIHDYELVHIYEYLQKKNDLTAKSLITKLKRLFLSIEEQEHIQKYRFISTNCPKGKAMVDVVLDKTYGIAVQMQEQAEHITKLETEISQKPASDKQHLLLNAAHERTDCELTAEGQERDDEIMKDDSEWK